MKELTKFLSIFNSYDDVRLQLTHEIENENKISFLDVLLIRNDERIDTDWYTKSTFSGRFLSFESPHSLLQKIAMVYNLVDRGIHLASKKFHDNNIKKVKTLLKNNSYPEKLRNT